MQPNITDLQIAMVFKVALDKISKKNQQIKILEDKIRSLQQQIDQKPSSPKMIPRDIELAQRLRSIEAERKQLKDKYQKSKDELKLFRTQTPETIKQTELEALKRNKNQLTADLQKNMTQMNVLNYYFWIVPTIDWVKFRCIKN